MGNPTGFIEFRRAEVGHRPIAERVRDWHEIDLPLTRQALAEQSARCMDCGIPFCHAHGCPLTNRIPEFNDLVYRGRWREAAENLHSTNNFPEFTGRVCPAPCEAACTLALNEQAVHIKHIEREIVQRAFREGWAQPVRAKYKTGKKVAVVGSGPAGLAASQQLARLGHEVVLFERDDRLGGLLRYGIPDFKLQKQIIDRRLEQMVAEGVRFEPGVDVGRDLAGRDLEDLFDAVCLTMGAGQPRPLEVPGADLAGVHFAMDFLREQNRRVAGDPVPDLQAVPGSPAVRGSPDRAPAAAGSGDLPRAPKSAKDRHVIVIGGGDTGSDCVGTAIRQGARSVHQIEILPKPPEGENPETPWPLWPQILRTSSSHEEGCRRSWSVLTKSLAGAGGHVTELCACRVDWVRTPDGYQMKEIPGSEFTLPADLVLLAMGFLHVVHGGLVGQLDLALDRRGNVVVRDWMTSRPGIFAAGDTVRGASLVVHAIHEGRLAAAQIDSWLKTPT